MVAAEIEGAPARPKLQLVSRADLSRSSPGMDAATRDLHYSRIRDISRLYRLQWLVRQECSSVHAVIESLDDDALIRLHATMERARECFADGVGLDEAGLVRAADMPI